MTVAAAFWMVTTVGLMGLHWNSSPFGRNGSHTRISTPVRRLATDPQRQPPVLLRALSDKNAAKDNEKDHDSHDRRVVVVHHTRANPPTTTTRFPAMARTDDNRIIFYHIYIPLEQNPQQQRAAEIVHEQLQQLSITTQTTTVMYNIVGARHVLTSQQMTQWCHHYGLECHLLQHYDQPGTMEEATTLQKVYEFCHDDETLQRTSSSHQLRRTTSVRVGYMHNKGSHHPSPLNDQWRYLITDAMGRPECWPSEDDNGVFNTTDTNTNTSRHCNVCGLHLTTDRGLYMAGNIWTADCDYIHQLVEPQHFQANMEALTKDAFLKRLQGEFIMTQYPHDEPSFFGVGRYAAEWWIGSHPSLQACDFSASVDPATSGGGYDRTKEFLNYVAESGRQRREAPAANMSLQQEKPYTPNLNFTQQAPHHAYKLPKPRALKARLAQDPNALKREFFLLPGLLYRWIHLYQAVPPDDSWVWRHYPEGGWWKEAVSKYKLEVLTMLPKR